MVKSHGSTRKCRHLFKYAKSQNKYAFNRKLLQHYNPGDLIALKINSRSKRGLPHRRHHGTHGQVINNWKTSVEILFNNNQRLSVSKAHILRI